MNTREIGVDSIITMWDASSSQLGALVSGLQSLGLEDVLIPNKRTDQVALKAALTRYCRDTETKDENLTVIPLKHTRINGFEVVDIGKEETQNDYLHRFSAKALDGIVTVTSGYAPTYRLQSLFEEELQVVDATTVGSYLGRTAAYLGGTVLRQNGGVWHLPASSAKQWDDIAGVYEKKECGNTLVHQTAIVKDDRSRRMVTLAVTRDIRESVEDLEKELRDTSVEHPQRYYENRKELCVQLQERVKAIESEMETELSEAQELLKKASQNAGIACLVASLPGSGSVSSYLP